MEYQLHPCVELQQLFAGMPLPHQGQDPTKAKVIFLGIDANYSPEISRDPHFFRRILEYHEDGVAFWQRHGVHHPFLLPDYPLPRNTGGVPYHRKFASMGLTPDFANHISFVELLNVPTTGRTTRAGFQAMFDAAHARSLDDLFASGDRRIWFLSNVAIRLMHEIRKREGVFKWLPRKPDWGRVCQLNETEVYKVRHFSSAISAEQLQQIGALVRSTCCRQPYQ